jgi:hypothetical protein
MKQPQAGIVQKHWLISGRNIENAASLTVSKDLMNQEPTAYAYIEPLHYWFIEHYDYKTLVNAVLKRTACSLRIKLPLA